MSNQLVIDSVTKSSGAAGEDQSVGGGIATPDQVPPDVKIRIGTQLYDLIRMVAIGPYDAGRYAADTEYWRWGADTDFRGVTSLQLTAEPFGSATGEVSIESTGMIESDGMIETVVDATGGASEKAIDAFFAQLSNELTHPRVIQTTDWPAGMRNVPSDRVGHLFWAYDPDNLERKIGLMVEVSATGTIEALVWYKTWIRQDCQIWSANPSYRNLELTRVVDAFGNVSTDPRDITPNVTWYYTVMGPGQSLVTASSRKAQSMRRIAVASGTAAMTEA